MPRRFTEKFAAGLASYGDLPCIEFEGRWYSGADITAYADAIASVLDGAGVAGRAPVGLVVRNRLPHAAVIIGFLAAGRPVSMIYSFQSPDAIGRDVEKLELSAIVADREDWSGEVIAAAKRAGCAGVAISLTIGNMRFGLFIPQGWRLDLVGIEPADQWRVMSDLATYVDEGGVWDSLWVYDHFHTVPMPTSEATHEAWTLMAAYAATTSRIKLGQMCTAMSYRNPVYLAKVAATADIVSGGRIQMGIGGGWYEHEWRAYGYGFPSAGVRLARLDEGVQIMRDAWRDGVVTFNGKHYQADGAIVAPRPLQGDGIPLWIAGGGEKVTLRIAAKYAQYTNFTSEPEGFAHKSQVLSEHCRDVGTDFGSIVRSANINAVIGASESEVKDRLSRVRSRISVLTGDAAADAMLNSMSTPQAGSGTPEQLVESLQRLRDLGCEYLICYFPEAAYDRSSVELFEREVIPAMS